MQLPDHKISGLTLPLSNACQGQKSQKNCDFFHLLIGVAASHNAISKNAKECKGMTKQ